MISSVLDNIIFSYKNILRKRPKVIFIMLIYVIFIFTFSIYKSQLKSSDIKKKELEVLRNDIKIKDKIINNLNFENNSLLYPDLKYKEKLDTIDKIRLLRMMEYANLAIKNEDFDYALEIYNDAEKELTTSIIPYKKSKILYQKGDMDKCIKELRKSIDSDPEVKYPELRLILSTLLQTNKDDSKEIIKLIKEYINNIETATNN